MAVLFLNERVFSFAFSAAKAGDAAVSINPSMSMSENVFFIAFSPFQ
ncbi:hypothetical protein BAP_1696 [Bacillus sp. CN2]|nr:hypothetical protein BAP_1696 [Bacillus sp. CN2]